MIFEFTPRVYPQCGDCLIAVVRLIAHLVPQQTHGYRKRQHWDVFCLWLLIYMSVIETVSYEHTLTVHNHANVSHPSHPFFKHRKIALSKVFPFTCTIVQSQLAVQKSNVKIITSTEKQILDSSPQLFQ